MLGLHVLGKGKVEIAEFPMPEPREDEVLIEVTASGVCGSEMGSVRGDAPMAANAGHEVAGIVADPNGHPQWEEGDRVGIFTLQGCGKCRWCRAGQDTFCAEMRVPAATHSQYVTSRATSMVRLPEDVTNPIAVLLCADGIGVPYGATTRAGVKCGDITCVFGCGPVGLGMVLMQSYLGAFVIAVEPSEARRNLAVKMGARQTIDPTAEGDVAAKLIGMSDGIGPDFAFECSGRQDTVDWAMTATRPEGTIVMVGHGQQSIDPQRLIIKKNHRMMGNWIAHPGTYPAMLAAFRDGLDLPRLITGMYKYDDAQEAYDQMLAGTCGKLMLLWD